MGAATLSNQIARDTYERRLEDLTDEQWTSVRRGHQYITKNYYNDWLLQILHQQFRSKKPTRMSEALA